MSKSSYKNGIKQNKVFASVVNIDKNGRPTAFRITNKSGKTIRIVGNGLSV